MERAAVEEHASVFDAVQSGQPLAADSAMRDHFFWSLKRYR